MHSSTPIRVVDIYNTIDPTTSLNAINVWICGVSESGTLLTASIPPSQDDMRNHSEVELNLVCDPECAFTLRIRHPHPGTTSNISLETYMEMLRKELKRDQIILINIPGIPAVWTKQIHAFLTERTFFEVVGLNLKNHKFPDLVAVIQLCGKFTSLSRLRIAQSSWIDGKRRTPGLRRMTDSLELETIIFEADGIVRTHDGDYGMLTIDGTFKGTLFVREQRSRHARALVTSSGQHNEHRA